MYNITAHHCDFCPKIYENKGTGRLHERKCFWNPATRSCASCAFLDLLRYDFENGNVTDFQVCLKMVDISNKLKTGCDHYHRAEFHEGYGYKINIPDHDFDKELTLQRLAGQIERLHRLQEKPIQELRSAPEADTKSDDNSLYMALDERIMFEILSKHIKTKGDQK
jgi:hypothetical protein